MHITASIRSLHLLSMRIIFLPWFYFLGDKHEKEKEKERQKQIEKENAEKAAKEVGWCRGLSTITFRIVKFERLFWDLKVHVLANMGFNVVGCREGGPARRGRWNRRGGDVWCRDHQGERRRWCWSPQYCGRLLRQDSSSLRQSAADKQTALNGRGTDSKKTSEKEDSHFHHLHSTLD